MAIAEAQSMARPAVAPRRDPLARRIAIRWADYVYILDPWWNPAVEAQAIDRAHRIGQTRPVFAYRLIARAVSSRVSPRPSCSSAGPTVSGTPPRRVTAVAIEMRVRVLGS